MFEPQASLFEQKGIGHVVASFGEASGKLPYTSYMSKQSYMKKNGDVLKRFTKAIYKAQLYVETHTAKETAELIAPYFEDTPVDLIEKVVDRYKGQHSYAVNPILEQDAWNNLQSVMKAAGELPKKADYKKLVNTTFSRDATK
ncbi:ABC transporter substrate-binding protein [Fictibacillus sp. S7]|uniref:ABC transporter substrate-binding protein n=1 Tax=Fictibacillus sp. S7 TaxID=2212476 RepID=UPI0019D6C90E